MIRRLVKSYEATVAIGAYLIVAFNDAASSSKVGLATAANQPLVGTTGQVGTSAAGMVDVEIGGIPQVRVGATVAAGDPLTANAASKAIKATTAGQRIIGWADQPGVADDIIDYRAAPGVLAV